jgi:hypothetical protein
MGSGQVGSEVPEASFYGADPVEKDTGRTVFYRDHHMSTYRPHTK